MARRLIDSGSYRTVTAAEAQEAVGVPAPGWVVHFQNLAGTGPLLTAGPGSAPFVRLKPSPALKPKKASSKPPKYLSAKGAGCRPYFSPLLSTAARDPKNPVDLDITEGEKKADAACAHGFDTIGLSGVDCFRDNRCNRDELLPELEAIAWKGGTVRIVYDSDVAHKPNVQAAMRRLAFALTRRGAEVLVVTIPCEIPDGPGNPTAEKWKNGLDDFLQRHGAEAYRIVRNLARECVEEERGEDGRIHLRWTWTPEPGREHGATRMKALLPWTVFKETVAVDPKLGVLLWTDTHWRILDGKPSERLAKAFLGWADAMAWPGVGLGASFTQLIEELRSEQQWNPPGTLAFLNGTLNTVTGEFFPGHRRDDCITILHPYRYDTAAKCPRWDGFINEALGGSKSKLRLLRAALRLTLEPRDRTRPAAAEFMFDIGGRRGAGKGVTAEVAVALVGGTEGGAGRLEMKSLDNPAALFGLIGKRMAFDPDAAGHLGNAGILNAIVSNEPVLVKKLYVNEYSTRLGVVVWRFFNDHISVSGGNEEGIGRRSIPITFDNPPARRDRTLKEKLLTELPGIFAWVWSMSLEEAIDALSTAAADAEILQAAIEAALNRNPKLRFLAEKYPEGGAIEAGELFRQWKLWCLTEGHHHGNKATFCAEVQKVTGKPRRIGQAKVTIYTVPAMEGFDFAAFLGLDRGEGRVDADAHPGDVGRTPRSPTPGRDGRCPSGSASAQRPGDVHPKSSQTPRPNSTFAQVDVDSSLEKKRESNGPRGEAEPGSVCRWDTQKVAAPFSTSTQAAVLAAIDAIGAAGQVLTVEAVLAAVPDAPRDAVLAIVRDLGAPVDSELIEIGDAVEVFNQALRAWQNGWRLESGPDLEGLYRIRKLEGSGSQHVRREALKRCRA
ncbi:MAG: DUF3854 domain-containing protein [Cyanobacteria bacterium J06638_7]